ncbi:hypothetical protein [Microbulbifer thermotolerans]|uniref:Uncharacterized protein n=1 Tax=Microbulbifer thermotolerans TaxID=252514 RepID=A0A143HM73_MICTH|nr:hypothetical protein [Microbulbifer thermotolerans]AMX02570.1 hypothetical protein A3224_08210 [Microbulbifer thermotolerans]MCX2779710.1 hypothetical protein [Microbulbifer thermotolerans]MCX2782358.1 hypothetical protein [Microbulbifer thermotolerans]MCX2794947.1 hypothetical protein [Microbulbifer thermotolerans]MCX2800511.1 hypothetical protein [Microbulbifer thermotolerans]
MTTAERIYQAVELFSAEEPHYHLFELAFQDALTSDGTPGADAEEMARVAAKSLRSLGYSDYHLAMAATIAYNSDFEKLMYGSPAAVQAMHKYMSYYLEFADHQQVAAVQ